jgi:hypothetical protein
MSMVVVYKLFYSITKIYYKKKNYLLFFHIISMFWCITNSKNLQVSFFKLNLKRFIIKKEKNLFICFFERLSKLLRLALYIYTSYDLHFVNLNLNNFKIFFNWGV